MPIQDVEGEPYPCKLTGLTHIQGGVTLGPEQGEPGADVSPVGKRRRWRSLANDRIL
jgi:hypothetical protein